MTKPIPLPQAIQLICDELVASREAHPTWPTDPLHALAIAAEELGEAQQATLQYIYEPDKATTLAQVRGEVVQAAAMLLEFLLSMHAMDFQAAYTLPRPRLTATVHSLRRPCRDNEPHHPD